MRKKLLGVLCILLLVLCVYPGAMAEDEAIIISIPTIQAGQDTEFTFSFAEGTIYEFHYNLYEQGSDNTLASGYFYPSSGSTSVTSTVNGYCLQPGDYSLVVQYTATDFNEMGPLQEDFTVSEGGQPVKPVLSMASTALYYGQSQRCSFTNVNNYYEYIR